MANYHLYSLQLNFNVPLISSKLLLHRNKSCNTVYFLQQPLLQHLNTSTDVTNDNSTNRNTKFHHSTQFMTMSLGFSWRGGKPTPPFYNVGGFNPYFFATSVWAWAASQSEYRWAISVSDLARLIALLNMSMAFSMFPLKEQNISMSVSISTSQNVMKSLNCATWSLTTLYKIAFNEC